jgi:hypothetical protein
MVRKAVKKTAKKVIKPAAKKIGARPKKEAIPVNELRAAAKAAAVRRLNK